MSDGTPVLIAGIKARLSKTDEEIDKELSVGELVMYDQCVALYTPGVYVCGRRRGFGIHARSSLRSRIRGRHP